MIPTLKLAKIFWSFTATFAIISAFAGIINRDIYNNLFPVEFLPGAFPQDVITVLLCFFMLWLSKSIKKDDIKKQVVMTGLLGSLFYLYGIFVIERVYNWFYLFYAATFALSFWSLIYTLSGFKSELFTKLKLSKAMLRTTAYSSLVIAAIFTALWVAALIPLMRDNNRIEYLYSIYILDLCFIMPAFAITAVMSLRNKPFGILLSPAIMILGFFVIFPLGLNELGKPYYRLQFNIGPMFVSFAFAIFMLTVAVLHLKKIRFE